MTCLAGNKRNEIIQVVKYLDERLKELEEEKKELREYQQLEKQRKSREYTIYDKDLHDVREKLEQVRENQMFYNCSLPDSEILCSFIQVEVARTKACEEYTEMYDRVEKTNHESMSLDESLKGLEKELKTLNNEKEIVVMRKTKLEVDVKEFKEWITGNEQFKVLLLITWCGGYTI